MFIQKNIWLLFYSLVLIGLIYLVSSIYSVWVNIQQRSAEELSYLNQIFSSSVTSTFDQQEVMLELLGQQLLQNNQPVNRKQSSHLLDNLLQQHSSLIGFGLANVDGQLLATSSNVDINKVPNLKDSVESRDSFLMALESEKMVLGTTYFLDALNSWIIPIRKAIRDIDHRLTGVMMAGIKPEELLPRLNELNSSQSINHFQAMLVHDDNFKYAYISGIADTDLEKDLINKPITKEILQLHNQSLKDQLGVSMTDLKTSLKSAEYIAPSYGGVINMYSMSYLPEYHLWSITYSPRSRLFDELNSSIIRNTLTFIFVIGVIFLLFRYINQFEQANRRQLINQANHDFLTGLNNRLYLNYAEPKWIHQNAEPFSIFFMDLDNFKNINDSYGHNFGDLILKQVSERLLALFTDKSLVCRQGGDEFIILCKKTDQLSLEEIAKKILESISTPYHIDHYRFTIGASIGICRYPNDGHSFNSLFSAADTAMYHAKNKQYNFFIFTNELKEQILHASNIEQALHTALQKNEFHMVYQPQIASKGSLYGVEALVRWNNAELGCIPPDKFISIAEDSGLILDIGNFIINQTIRDMSELGNKHDYFYPQLSINISVRQFLQQGFLDHLNNCLLTHKFPSKQLTLEITESIFIEDFEYMLPLFKDIRDLGIKLSLDDFGTGFSSLSMLRKLPIDELKIDKSFIDQIIDNKRDAAMILSIMDIAHNLGLKTVAEGIELQQQADLLADYHCDIQQGYYHSRPLTYSQLIEFCSGYVSGFQTPY